MKSSLIFFAAFFLITFTSQAQQIAQSTESEVIEMGTPGEVEGEKLVGVYQQIEQHSAKLTEARAEYADKLAAAQTEEEKAEYSEIIENIDEMLLTNERLLAGNATIQSVDMVEK